MNRDRKEKSETRNLKSQISSFDVAALPRGGYYADDDSKHVKETKPSRYNRGDNCKHFALIENDA